MLPESWKPVSTAALTRLGAPHEGGYVVSSKAIDRSCILLSMGLCADWSFEADYICRTGRRVICYDHSVDKIFWAWYTLHGLVRMSRERLAKFLKYREFFSSGKAEHRRIKVGYDVPGSASLGTILRAISEEQLFLKVDIEGSEYRVLSDIVSHAGRFTGMVMEFHDIDLHRQRISDFLACLEEFAVVNLHANNFGGIDARGNPLVIEVSLARKDYCCLARGQDLNTANHPGLPDILTVYGEAAKLR